MGAIDGLSRANKGRTMLRPCGHTLCLLCVTGGRIMMCFRTYCGGLTTRVRWAVPRCTEQSNRVNLQARIVVSSAVWRHYCVFLPVTKTCECTSSVLRLTQGYGHEWGANTTIARASWPERTQAQVPSNRRRREATVPRSFKTSCEGVSARNDHRSRHRHAPTITTECSTVRA